MDLWSDGPLFHETDINNPGESEGVGPSDRRHS
jgi:hypothetical protein